MRTQHIFRMALAVLLLGSAAGAQAQLNRGSLGSGVTFQGYQFGGESQIEAANLILVPIAYQQPLGSKLGADLYSGFARGAVLISGTEYTLSGPVDTRLRASYQATPWALLTLGFNLPTGKAEHTDAEAHVSTFLATELLGFREASWGLGSGVTTGIATAHHLGSLGVGVGASYRKASEFRPVADSALDYRPGDEVRLRVAVDRNIGAAKLTAGVTFQNYSEDQVDGQNLFQPGNRWRGDMTYSFRTSANGAWTFYVTDLWRAHGDVFIADITTGAPTTRVGTQNLLMSGLVGSVRMFNRTLMPSLDFRMQTREDPGGEGWMGGAGMEVPARLGTFELRPAAKLYLGSLSPVDESYSFYGGELSLGIRWGGNR